MKEERSRTTAIDGTKQEKLSKEVVNHNDEKGISKATTSQFVFQSLKNRFSNILRIGTTHIDVL